MLLRTVIPHPAVARYVHHFWVFESATGLPSGDARVVVPNGRPKLIVPYRNGLCARRAVDDDTRASQHDDPVLVGLWEEPSVIASRQAPTVTVGVEFTSAAIPRFVPVEAHELAGRVTDLGDILGPPGRALARRVREAPDVDAAVAIVQRFLVARLTDETPASQLVDAALAMLHEGARRGEVASLERRTGYSQRHLLQLFRAHVGLGPKRLASVLTFERVYRRFSQQKSVAQLRNDALDLFYDQSHFIRTFRRFTGFAPTRFAELDNEFGRIFYVAPR